MHLHFASLLKDVLNSISLLCLFLISTTNQAQNIRHYDGNVTLVDKGAIHANFKLQYENSNNPTFHLYLNKNASVKYIKINNIRVAYSIEEATNMMVDLKKIVITNNFPKKFSLEIEYAYPLRLIENPTFKYDPNWIELNLYTGWYPFTLQDENYSYHVRISHPKTYQAISSGVVKTNGSTTLLKNEDNYKDIPVVLSDDFQLFTPRDPHIQFYSIALTDVQIQDIKENSDSIHSFFDTLFTKSDSRNLIIAVNPFAHPMSYSRKGFISLSLKNGFSDNDKRILAHEIGHLWWKNAPFGTYEEWLNESFAEYSALKWLEQKLSKSEFDTLLTKYENAYKNPLKISAINPSSTDWYSIAYFKYPYVLYKLEQKIGTKKMADFLKQTYRNKISNTQNLLQLLSRYADETTITEFRGEIY